jgi:hypothetical protein
MVSKTLASLDAWLALAEEVLAEQMLAEQVLAEQRQRSERDAETAPPPAADQLTLFTFEAA